ncbi:MAG: tetratricopeptide repeat protein [Candidatus Aenigmarchaeota archaeon]|nr:tetratricopeptide repeat protein [Candidatus Aenigmarchaeota archaeon]
MRWCSVEKIGERGRIITLENVADTVNKGVIYGKMDDPEKALTYLNRALEIYPQHKQAQKNKKIALSKLKRK